MLGVELARGDRVRISSPGGGGYGPAGAREPRAVARDVRLGYVSAAAALRDYMVVLHPDGTVDVAGTEALRSAK